ncbi:hypothetical protein [Shewanella fodinae]|uniref:Uncharacterized protein n=1 Tax=Shewanella fodinae TaxID=552357 RepID=A0A4R2F2G3_9GAMM|nr:hypothetical protein [Shewanella fodinae]TCN77356.1 hypothetical protein EDC91_14712 [Shewanella fodinae]
MKLVIPIEELSVLKTAVENIDTKYQYCRVSFIVNPAEKTLTILTGQKPTNACCTVPLAPESTALQATQFSIDGGFLKDLMNDSASSKKDMVLDIEMTGSAAKWFEVLFLTPGFENQGGHSSVRRWRCKAADKQQLNYLGDIQSRPTNKFSPNTGKAICEEAIANLPFEFFEINKDKRQARTLRNGVIEETKLPEHIKLPFDVVLNPTAATLLSTLCDEPGVDVIEMAQQGEEITFKTQRQAITCIMTGIENFYHKNSLIFTEKQCLFVSFYTFRKMVRKWLNNKEIRKADEAILYIDDSTLAIFAVNEEFQFGDIIPVFSIDPKAAGFNCCMFRFKAQTILKTKIKNMIESSKIKISIVEDGKGGTLLRTYHSPKNELKTDSFYITPDEHQLPTVQMLLKKLIEVEGKQRKEAQQDMFDF